MLQDYLSNPIVDELLNWIYHEGDVFDNIINSTDVPSTANDVPSTSVVAAAATTATESSPDTHSVPALPCNEPSVPSSKSFDESLEFISNLLIPQSPPELEPHILTSFSDLPMAPISPTNQLNQMIPPSAYASYPPDSMVSQISLDLPPHLGMEASTLQPCAYTDPICGGIEGGVYSDGMAIPTCGAEDQFGSFAGAGMAFPTCGADNQFGFFVGGGMAVPTCGADNKFGFLAGSRMAVPTYGAHHQFGFFANAEMAVRPPEAVKTSCLGIYSPRSMQKLYDPGDVQVNQMKIKFLEFT